MDYMTKHMVELVQTMGQELINHAKDIVGDARNLEKIEILVQLPCITTGNIFQEPKMEVKKEMFFERHEHSTNAIGVFKVADQGNSIVRTACQEDIDRF